MFSATREPANMTGADPLRGWVAATPPARRSSGLEDGDLYLKPDRRGARPDPPDFSVVGPARPPAVDVIRGDPSQERGVSEERRARASGVGRPIRRVG